MNDLAREKLVKAALNGVPQTTGEFVNTRQASTAYCALGVLGWHDEMSDETEQELLELYAFGREMFQCPVCILCAEASNIVMHLNDTHQWSFLDIARKFPEEPVKA